MAVERERACRAALPARADERSEVKVAGGVPADDEEILAAEEIRAVFHAAGGAERLILDPVAERKPERAAVPEGVDDLLRAVFQRGADLGEALCGEQAQDMLHHGASEQRREGLGVPARHGAQPAALAAGQDDCLHGKTLLNESVLMLLLFAGTGKISVVIEKGIWYNILSVIMA